MSLQWLLLSQGSPASPLSTMRTATSLHCLLQPSYPNPKIPTHTIGSLLHNLLPLQMSSSRFCHDNTILHKALYHELRCELPHGSNCLLSKCLRWWLQVTSVITQVLSPRWLLLNSIEPSLRMRMEDHGVSRGESEELGESQVGFWMLYLFI